MDLMEVIIGSVGDCTVSAVVALGLGKDEGSSVDGCGVKVLVDV